MVLREQNPAGMAILYVQRTYIEHFSKTNFMSKSACHVPFVRKTVFD